MKRLILIAIMLMAAFNSFAIDGKTIYNRYSDADNVSAVYISPVMFKLVGKLPKMEVGDSDVDLSSVIKSLKGMYIIDSRNISINDDLHGDVERLVKSGRYELMMEVKEDGETVHMYTVGDELFVDGFVMTVNEKDNCTFICLDCRMNRKEFEKMILNYNK